MTLGFVLAVFVFLILLESNGGNGGIGGNGGRELCFFSVYELICAKCKADFMNFVRFGKYLAKLHNIY